MTKAIFIKLLHNAPIILPVVLKKAIKNTYLKSQEGVVLLVFLCVCYKFYFSCYCPNILLTLSPPLGLSLPVLSLSFCCLLPRMTVQWAVRTWTALSPRGSQLSSRRCQSPVQLMKNKPTTQQQLWRRKTVRTRKPAAFIPAPRRGTGFVFFYLYTITQQDIQNILRKYIIIISSFQSQPLQLISSF